MSSSLPSTSPQSSSEITRLGGAELARRIAAGDWSSVEVTRAFIQRIELVNRDLNAVVIPLFDSAIKAAEQADLAMARGDALGPLHGVPVTIKECFHVAGTSSCIGLEALRSEIMPDDGVLVRRLRNAGAVILGKTNIPQMMIWHECDNPVYGRTNNPWDLTRTPGGSTGGEAAIIAAGGSPLGLGNDLGGSIRVPCHFCGIHGIKPTSHRLPRTGSRGTLRGMEAVVSQAGPLARRVEDLELGLRVLVGGSEETATPDVAPPTWTDPRSVHIRGMKIALWTNDDFFPASAALARAVREAGTALAQRGAIVEEFAPPDVPEIMETYFSLLGADGGADARRLTAGSKLDWRVARMLRLAGLPLALRLPIVAGLRGFGQHWMSRLVGSTRPRSANSYWQLVSRKNQLVRDFMHQLQARGYSAFLTPPHALPAMQHIKGFDLLPAASYAYLPNLLGVPAGVVSLTRVRPGEETGRIVSRDQTLRQAAAVDRGSAGLPVGVQVAAPHWREDIVLAIMRALEDHFASQSEYPCHDHASNT